MLCFLSSTRQFHQKRCADEHKYMRSFLLSTDVLLSSRLAQTQAQRSARRAPCLNGTRYETQSDSSSQGRHQRILIAGAMGVL